MNAVLVFCEGAHDVTFVCRSLGSAKNCKWISDTIDSLPTPFGRGPTAGKGRVGGLIAQHYGKQSIDELQFSEASRAPIPVFDSALDLPGGSTRYYVLRTGGDRTSSAVLDLIQRVDAAYENDGANFQTKQIAYAFLFDADDAGVSARENAFSEAFGGYFDLATASHGTWQTTSKGPVGLWIHHDAATKTGTLEHHLAPLFANAAPGRWKAADDFIAAHATPDDPVRRQPSRRVKAQITIAGQTVRPGDPMSEMLRPGNSRRPGILAGPAFQGGAAGELADFLVGVPWP